MAELFAGLVLWRVLLGLVLIILALSLALYARRRRP